MPRAPIPMKSAVKRAWQRRAVAPSQADYFHHIWAPSPHAAGALKNADIAAHMVPYPIPIWPNGLIAPEPSDVFKVISFADTQSSLSRKNPLGSVAAFSRAFTDVDDVALIIKLSNADRAKPADIAALRSACESDSRITLNTDVLTRKNAGCRAAGANSPNGR